MFKSHQIKKAKARRGKFQCAHGGEVQTPVFMNVGTQAAIKGGVSALDLKELGCQIELSNTYHLHLRPGDDVVRQMGGLHKFMHWDGPILTDSGGVSSIFPCGPAQNQRRGRDIRLSPRRPPHLHGAGGERAHPVKPRQRHCDGVRRVRGKTRHATSTRRHPASARCAGWSAARQSMTS